MKYIIMADGKGARWNNYNNVPKHLIEINGETLLSRIVRLLKIYDSESQIIITSHDERYEVEGATRYEPQNNVLELDRFTRELIEDEICFLYGDTYYSQEAIQQIINGETEDVLFFGNLQSIVAVKIKKAEVFVRHLNNVRTLFEAGKINGCKGWQVYQSFADLPFDEKKIGKKYICINDETEDFNSLEDYKKIMKEEVL